MQTFPPPLAPRPLPEPKDWSGINWLAFVTALFVAGATAAALALAVIYML